MIRLLIADDEPETRSAIREMIPWEENGVRVCAEAPNGREAIRLLEEQRPDVALLDIRMPLADGLEVAKHIHEREMPCKAIILSGYGEFEYAQRALRYGAVNYLLKPCKPEEILASVLSVREHLPGEPPADGRESAGLSAILSGTGGLGRPPPHAGCRMAVALLRPQSPRQAAAVYREARPLLEPFWVEGDCTGRDARFLLVLEGHGQGALLQAMERARQGCEAAGLLLQAGALGFPTPDPAQLTASYQSAVRALEQSFFAGEAQIAIAECPCGERALAPLLPLEQELLQVVRTADREKAMRAFGVFFDGFCCERHTRDAVLGSCFSLLMGIFQIYIDCQLRLPQALETGVRYRVLEEFSSLEQLRGWLETLIEDLCGQVAAKAAGSSAVHAAIRYIEEHYAENIDLNRLSSQAHITPAYLSLQFKQVTGINYIDYLNRTRIQNACILLKDLELKTYQVAELVGYKDEKYFARIFKKTMGVSPSRYRKISS